MMNSEELLKIAKPILFSTPMTIAAILENRKGAMRRVIKPQPPAELQFPYGFITGSSDTKEIGKFCWTTGEICDGRIHAVKPQYKVGDILYVRETWRYAKKGYRYRADWEQDGIGDIGKWKPSLFMPKEAARLFLKVTGVGVERLRDIDKQWSNYDKEGMRNPETENISIAMQEKFIDMWNSTIKKQDLNKYGWDANPWVFVYEFERVVPE